METTIYVALKDEGVDVWRPVSAEAHAGGFLILGPVPDGERWEFAPGTLVRCEMRMLREGAKPSPQPVAVEAVPPTPRK